MSVVVYHRDAIHLAAMLESPLRAGKLGEGRRDLVEWHMEFEADAHRRQRVLNRVTPRNAHAQLAEHLGRLPVPTAGAANDGTDAAEPFQNDVMRADLRVVARQPIRDDSPVEPRKKGVELRIINTRDDGAVKGHLVREFDKRLLQLGKAAIRLHVLAVHVGEYRDRRPQHEKGPVAFVGLGDHVLASSEP
jgi:hypothetical protein